MSRFYGGVLDGVEREDVVGHRYVTIVSTRERQTYVRDRSRYVRETSGEIRRLAYVIEKVERCSIVGSHEGPCDWQLVPPTTVTHVYSNRCHDEAEVWCGDEHYYRHDEVYQLFREPVVEPEKATCRQCLMEIETFGRRAAVRLADLSRSTT